MSDPTTNGEAPARARRKQRPPRPPAAPTPPLSLSPEMIAACARQDVPAAGMAELRAQVALIGERARRVAITTEYERMLSPEATPDA